MDRVGWERIAPSLVGSWVGEARPSGEAFVADLCCGQQNWLGLYRLAPWVLRAWQFGQRVIPHPPANCSQAATIAVTITVAAAWTGHLPNGSDYHGLSLYRVIDGRVTEARHALIGPPPA